MGIMHRKVTRSTYVFRFTFRYKNCTLDLDLFSFGANKKHEPRRVNQPLIFILSFISRFYIPNFHNHIWRLLYDIIKFFLWLFSYMWSWLLNGAMHSETVQEASRLYTGIVWRNEPSFLDEWTVKILFIHA